MLQQAKNNNACYSVGHSVSSDQHLMFAIILHASLLLIKISFNNNI